MEEDMYTHHYYKQRSIVKPQPLEHYLLHGSLACGLLFICLSLAVWAK
ncbi:MAG: hypothetical protein E6X17_01010 [Sporomusaceae bacterium]|nr:hypothetical protein [Sporomusaceae bacterium]